MQDSSGSSDQSPAQASNSPADQPRGVWRDIQHVGWLLKRYFLADRWMASLLLGYQVASAALMSLIYLQIALNLAAITNALAAKNAAGLAAPISGAMGFTLAMLGVSTLQLYTRFVLRIRFRRVITDNILSRWLAEKRFFQLDQQGRIDQPEQRIQEDVYQFIDRVMELGPGMLSAFFGIFIYTGQLWALSPPMTLPDVGITQPFPGSLVYVAFGFAIAFTLLTHWVGVSLTRNEVARQGLEARFRLQMSAVRLNSESIAFARAGRIESNRLENTFNLIRKNWWAYTRSNMTVNFVSGLPGTILIVAPALLCAPFVLNGQMQVGDVALVGFALSGVYGGVGLLISNYDQLALLRSAVIRLRAMHELLETRQPTDISVSEDESGDISVRGLKIAYPDGQLMNDVGDLTIAPGDRVLVQGKSGAGKSTLLRSIAGLWPFGGGRVSLPKDAKIAFLPQRGYMPDGTLASLMSYPLTSDAHADAVYTDLLEHLGLGRLAARLHDYEPWSRILSPGEQQRIAAARAILAAPDFLFVDEATSALDAASEANLYGLLASRLPNTALISVAHRQTVERYHDATIKLESGQTTRTPLARTGTA